MTGSHYQRASFLCNQKRYEEALAELQQAVAEYDKDVYAQGLLAICFSELDRHQQALEAAKRVVELAPDCDHGYYVLARVYCDRSRLDEAFEAISNAVRINPDDDMNHAWMARIECERGNWDAAVTAANAGLALDAENEMCLHYRSMALDTLGRHDEARRDQDQLLAADPEDPHTHAARGWTLLGEGDSEKAKEHFFEALRIDPRLDHARVGLANALKARHFIFGCVLRALLYVDRFRTWGIWAFMILLLVGFRILDRIATVNGNAVVPVFVLKAVFFTGILLVMLSQPLFGLVLRLDREGRRAMSRDELCASNWHAVCLIIGLALALLWAAQGRALLMLYAYATVVLCWPITVTFQTTPGWVRTRMAWLTCLAAVIIPVSYVLSIVFAMLILKYKLPLGMPLRISLFYLPLISAVISVFAEDIAAFFERRRPDAFPVERHAR